MPNGKFLSLLIISLLFCSPILASDIDREEDPCYFRVTAQDGRRIYVLGSIHSIKIEDAFPKEALEEFRRIATEEHPVLFTEHVLSNKHALQIIESEKNAVQAKQDWSSSIITREYHSLLSQKLFIEVGGISEYTVGDMLKIEPWLAAPILSTHAGIIVYPNFGGTEYNLETDEIWKNCWSKVCYLEGPEHYDLLKKASVQDAQFTLGWIKSIFDKLLLANSILVKPQGNEGSLELAVLESEKETATMNMTKLLEGAKMRFKVRGWKSVKSSSQSFPRSVIARNHLWSDFIINRLSHTSLEQEPQPYVIVVGDGHLAGDDSFFSLLITAIKPQSVERFINQSKSWKKPL